MQILTHGNTFIEEKDLILKAYFLLIAVKYGTNEAICVSDMPKVARKAH
jgi:hypothetical protein